MFLDLIKGQQVLELFITDEINLVDFVRGPEAIKEMQKGYTRVESGHLGNDRHIMGLLDIKGAQHGQSASTDQHGITVVTINGQGFSGQSTGCHVDDRWEEFTGDLVEVGDVK